MNKEQTKHHFSFPRINPTIESTWFVSLVCAALVVGVMAAYGGILFARIIQTDARSVESEVATQTINRQELAEAVTLFEARVQAFEATKTNPTVPSNPAR